MKNRKANLLSKFLISYIMVFLFPVVIFLGYYYSYSTKLVEQKEMDWNVHVTEQFMNSMDIFTSYVYDLPSELVRNREIKLYMTDESDYQRIVVASEMRKYNATDAFIYNTLLYVKDVDYFFAKTGSVYSVEDFEKPGVGFVYSNWPVQEMKTELDKLASTMIRPVEEVVVPGNNRLRMMTFVMPLPLGGSNSPGVVLIMVEEDTIKRLMRSVSEAYTGTFFMMDYTGKMLFASDADEYNGANELNPILQQLDEKGASSAIVQLNGERAIISKSVSDKNGLRYISVMPLTDTLKDIQAIQRNTLLLLCLVLFIELIVIYVSIRKNYHPIKRLVKLAAEIFDRHDPETMNEIETIRYALDQLSAANSKLDERMKQTLPIVRDNLLYELVSGKHLEWEPFRREASAYGLEFGTAFATTAVFICQSQECDMERILEYCRQQEERLQEGMRGYFFRSIYHHEFIFVCTHEREEQPKHVLTHIQRQIMKEYAVELRIGIGNSEPADTPEGVHHSYLQAVRTAEQLRLCKKEKLITYDEISVTNFSTVSYYAEVLQSLEISILKHDVQMIRSVMNRILELMTSGGMLPHIVRAVYLNTVSVIFNGLQRFQSDDQHVLRLADAAYHHRYTLDQMTGIMRDSCEKLCEIILETLPASRTVNVEEILAFIHENGTSQDFSLQRIADHFGMSLSNFSHYFKKNLGQNFKDYVDKHRMHKAFHLLKTTDEPLEKVANETGYSSTSSFIRTFKKVVGTTPGQYREAHKNKGSSIFED